MICYVFVSLFATLFIMLELGLCLISASLIDVVPTKYKGKDHDMPFILFILIIFIPNDLVEYASVMSDHFNLFTRYKVMPESFMQIELINQMPNNGAIIFIKSNDITCSLN